MRFTSPSPEQTLRAGAALAGVRGAEGLVVALEGPLGAGKTVFAKGLAAGLGVDPVHVASPTFVIASEYEAAGGARLAHLDLYRIESEGELEAAGFLDLLEPGSVVAIEWADRFPAALPADCLRVEIARPSSAASEAERVLHAWASGAAAAAALTRWQAALAALPELLVLETG